MSALKDEAKRLIDDLPEAATWEDIVYQLYVRKKIEEGIKASEEGRVVSHEEVKRRFSRQ